MHVWMHACAWVVQVAKGPINKNYIYELQTNQPETQKSPASNKQVQGQELPVPLSMTQAMENQSF